MLSSPPLPAGFHRRSSSLEHESAKLKTNFREFPPGTMAYNSDDRGHASSAGLLSDSRQAHPISHSAQKYRGWSAKKVGKSVDLRPQLGTRYRDLRCRPGAVASARFSGRPKQSPTAFAHAF